MDDTTTTLSPTRTITGSPEFEFWMVRNPSFPQPNILSADELFVDGVLLPLHLLPNASKPDLVPKTPQPDTETPTLAHDPEPSPAITDSVTIITASKRWKDIFRKSNKTTAEDNSEKAKKKDKKGGGTGGAAASAAAELNINIWPFSRSRSAGNAGTRPRLFAPVVRKANSAPCSRSNSAGESMSRKWPSSPGRVGVHLGRSSPVWQVRRGANTNASKNVESPSLNPEKPKRETPTSRRSKLASSGADNTKAKVLYVNVPICRSYNNNCATGLSGGSDNRHGHGGDFGGKIFNLRSFFSKKSIVTSH